MNNYDNDDELEDFDSPKPDYDEDEWDGRLTKTTHHPKELKSKAVDLVKKGYTYNQIAAQLKVKRNTLIQWLYSDPIIKEHRHQVLTQKVENVVNELNVAGLEALEEMIDIMHNAKNPPKLRAQVAKDILTVAPFVVKKNLHEIDVKGLSDDELVKRLSEKGVQFALAEAVIFPDEEEIEAEIIDED